MPRISTIPKICDRIVGLAPASGLAPKFAIAGMPVLKAYKARQLIANKLWMAPGYPGPDHGLCYVGKTMTGVGDAKKVIGEMCNAV